MDHRQVALGCQTIPVPCSLELEGYILQAYNDGLRQYHWSPRSPNNCEEYIAPPTAFCTKRVKSCLCRLLRFASILSNIVDVSVVSTRNLLQYETDRFEIRMRHSKSCEVVLFVC